MNRRRSWQLPSLLSSWLRRVLTAGVECDLKSQSIERRCDERETRRMKAKRYKAKLSFLSYRRATCFHLLWAAANTIVPSHPLFTITYLLPRQFSCTPYNKCSGFEPLLNLNNSQEQAFRTASNSKYGMNVSHSFKCAQLTKPG
jgi:hypothetical protein